MKMQINDPVFLKSEQEECDKIFNNILRLVEGYSSAGNMQVIRDAYLTAKSVHGNQARQSGELYLRHPLAVMGSLARLESSTNVLVAALLHDTIEDCGMEYEVIRQEFSEEIADIVNAVTAIKREEQNMDDIMASMSEQEIHSFLDDLTDAKLINSPYQREAFLVRLADREHNLSTIDAVPANKRRMKIQQTRAFLIPAAEKLGMRYFATVLSDYCEKYDDTDELDDILFGSQVNSDYMTLKGMRNAILFESSNDLFTFDKAIKEGIASQEYFSFPNFNPLSAASSNNTFRPDWRSNVNRRRTLLPYEIMKQTSHQINIHRQDAALCEVILVGQDEKKSKLLDNFVSFYTTWLKSKGLSFEYDYQNDSSDKQYIEILLVDNTENQYRIVIIPQSFLREYFIGNEKSARLTMIGERDGNDAVHDTITVYARGTEVKNGERQRIKTRTMPKGSTALDFAFSLKPSMAFTAVDGHVHIKKYAGDPLMVFSNEDYQYSLKTVLADGDVVKFDFDYDPKTKTGTDHAQLEWFNYVNTINAREHLINYFKEKVK